MYTVKLEEIVDAQDALIELGRLPLPTVTALGVMKQLMFFDSELRGFKEKYGDLVAEYATEKEDGDVEVLPGKKKEFTKRVKEVLEAEVSVTVPKFSLSTFEGHNISSLTLLKLMPFFEES